MMEEEEACEGRWKMVGNYTNVNFKFWPRKTIFNGKQPDECGGAAVNGRKKIRKVIQRRSGALSGYI